MIKLYRGRGCCYAPTICIGDTFIAILDLDCGNNANTKDRDTFLEFIFRTHPLLTESMEEKIKFYRKKNGYKTPSFKTACFT